MDDDVEVAPIYRCNGKVLPPTRPHENHGLAIENLPTWTESLCKQQSKLISSSCTWIIGKFIQNPGITEMHVTSAARLKLAPCTTTTKIDGLMNDNSCLMTNLYHSILPFDGQYTDGMHQIFKQLNRSLLQLTHHSPLNLLHNDAFDININLQKQILSTVFSRFYSIYIDMNGTDYWPMAGEYSIWNATIASLQFWTANLNTHTLGNAIEEVYSAFFTQHQLHTLHQQSDKKLSSHFMTTLNAAFE